MIHILLVEDNEMNRDMLSRRLNRNGFEILTARDGEEAIRMSVSEKPDLIIMDMGLPVIDGWEASRRIKKNSKTACIPILGLSAHAMKSSRRKALEAGCADYDTKPVNLKRLISKINNLLAPDGDET
jgi:two-component system, cell cycle response regulator DivK